MTVGNYKIASYCSSPSWGGLEMNVLRFLHWMQQRGWSVILYANPDSKMYAEAKNRDLTVRPITSRLRYGDIVNGRRLAKAIRRDNVRRLIIHQSQDMFLGVTAKLFAGDGIRLVYSQHMHIGGTKKDWFHSKLYAQIDAWITPVEWLAERVKEKTFIDPERIHIIPRGIELNRFTEHQPKKEVARRRFGLPENDPVIGLIGRLDYKKGQHIAIAALAKVRAEGHRAHLLLVGDQSYAEGDEYVAQINELVRDLRLEKYVHFRPHEPEVEYAYAALDVFVLASKSECYGMVTVEALSSGLPVIGTNDGGTISLIDHGRNGLLVPPLDVDALVNALLRLLGDNGFRKSIASEARRDGLAKFSHIRQCDAWEVVLDKLK